MRFKAIVMLGCAAALAGCAVPPPPPRVTVLQTDDMAAQGWLTRSVAAFELNERGKALMAELNYVDARREFEAAMARDPGYAAPYHNRALTRAAASDYAAAIPDYTEAIRLAPSLIAAYANRARAYAAQTEFAKAIADYSEAARLNPHTTIYLKARAALREQTQDYANAVADYDAALLIDPNDSGMQLARLKLYGRLAPADKAKADQAALAETKKNRSFAASGADYRAQAVASMALKDWAAAVNSYERLSVFARRLDDYDGLGESLYRNGDYGKAIAEYSAGLKLRPKDARLLTARGHVYRATRQYDLALADYDAALKVTPDAPAATTGRELILSAKPGLLSSR